VLKLGAIDFHDTIGVAEENFGGRFDYARFPGTSRSEKQHRADRASRWIHTREKYLVEPAHAAHGALLAYDSPAQPVLKVLCPWTLLIRIEKYRFIHLFFRGTHFFFQFSNHDLVSAGNDFRSLPGVVACGSSVVL